MWGVAPTPKGVDMSAIERRTRTADLVGRRRTFVAGLLVFAVASLLARLAWSADALVAARALQGVGAALMTPSALSILSTTFAEGAERNRALSIWGASAATGGTAGLILGGALTDTVGWEWVFLLNVPIALGAALLAPALVAESRAADGPRRLDVPGALLATLGVSLAVYGIVDAEGAGWGSTRTVAVFALAAAALAAFVAVEARSRAPLVPLALFRMRTLVGSNLVALLFTAATYGTYLVITLYLQQVLGLSPLEAGFAWLALSLTALASSLAVAPVVTRLGGRIPLVAGAALVSGGLYALTGIPVDGEYVSDLLPALVVTGLGVGTVSVAVSIGALAGVPARDAGLASGMVNTAQQVGGALGVAVLSTVAVDRAESAAAGGAAAGAALTEGFQLALAVAVGFALAAGVAAVALVRGRPPREAAEPAPVAAVELERAA